MIQIIVVLLFCILELVSRHYATTTVTITPNGAHTDVSTGEKTWYFWVSNHHRQLFRVGDSYQLEANQQKTQWQLYSVTYAAIKPASLRLGFQSGQSTVLMPVATDYQVTPMQFVRKR